MDNLTLGLGATSTGAIVLMIIAFLVRRGLHSQCMVGGQVITLDVHRVNPEPEVPTPDNATTVSVEEVLPEVPRTAVQSAVQVAPHRPPPLHPVRTPKEPRLSHPTPRASKANAENHTV